MRSFIICMPFYRAIKIKKIDVGGACGTYGGEEMCI